VIFHQSKDKKEGDLVRIKLLSIDNKTRQRNELKMEKKYNVNNIYTLLYYLSPILSYGYG
jgi:hypothetical protein